MKTYISILILILTLLFSNSSLQAEWEKADGYEFLKDKTFKGSFKRFVQDGKYLLSREKDTLYLYETESLNLEKSWVIANIEDADVSDDLEYIIYGKYVLDKFVGWLPNVYIMKTKEMNIRDSMTIFMQFTDISEPSNLIQINYIKSSNQILIMAGGRVFTFGNQETDGGVSILYDFNINKFSKLDDSYRKNIININSIQKTANISFYRYLRDYGSTSYYKTAYGWQFIDLETQKVLASSVFESIDSYSNLHPNGNSHSEYKSDFTGANGVYNKKYNYFYYQAFPYGKTFKAHGRKQSLLSNELQQVNNVNSSDAEFFLDDEYLISMSNKNLILYSQVNMDYEFRLQLPRKLHILEKVSDTLLYAIGDSNYLYRLSPNNFNNILVASIYKAENFVAIEDTLEFFNRSYGVYDSSEWDFGDGKKSNEMNPKHIYKDTGTYRIILKVKRDSILRYDTVSIIVRPKLIFDLGISKIIDEVPFNLTFKPIFSDNVKNVSVDFGNGKTYTYTNLDSILSISYDKAWEYDIKVTFSDGYVNKLFEFSKYITAKEKQSKDFASSFKNIEYDDYSSINLKYSNSVLSSFRTKGNEFVCQITKHKHPLWYNDGTYFNKWDAVYMQSSEFVRISNDGKILARKLINSNVQNTIPLKRISENKYLNIFFKDSTNKSDGFEGNRMTLEVLDSNANIIMITRHYFATSINLQDAAIDESGNIYIYYENILKGNRIEFNLLKTNPSLSFINAYRDTLQYTKQQSMGKIKISSDGRIQVLSNYSKQIQLYSVREFNSDLIEMNRKYDEIKNVIPAHYEHGYFEYNDFYLKDSILSIIGNVHSISSIEDDWKMQNNSYIYIIHTKSNSSTLTLFKEYGNNYLNLSSILPLSNGNFAVVGSSKLKDSLYVFIYNDSLNLIDTKTINHNFLLLQGTRLNDDGSLTLWGASNNNYKNIFVSYIAETIPVLSEYTSATNPISTIQDLVKIIYPNPSSEKLTIELSPQPDSNCTITIYDLQSNIVLERSTISGELTQTFDISSFALGTYFIKVQNGNTFEYKKFIKIN